MWLIYFIGSLVATAAFQTPICPPGGPPICATNGQAYIYFENECKLGAYVYKQVLAGKPVPVRTDIENCLLDCQEIICPKLYKPVCAQRLPAGPTKTVSNACLVDRLACETKQRWVIIDERPCSTLPATPVSTHLNYPSENAESYQRFDPSQNAVQSTYGETELEYATKAPDNGAQEPKYVKDYLAEAEANYVTPKPQYAEQVTDYAPQGEDYAARGSIHPADYGHQSPTYKAPEANYSAEGAKQDYAKQAAVYAPQGEEAQRPNYPAPALDYARANYAQNGSDYATQVKDYVVRGAEQDYAEQIPAPAPNSYADKETQTIAPISATYAAKEQDYSGPAAASTNYKAAKKYTKSYQAPSAPYTDQKEEYTNKASDYVAPDYSPKEYPEFNLPYVSKEQKDTAACVTSDQDAAHVPVAYTTPSPSNKAYLAEGENYAPAKAPSSYAEQKENYATQHSLQTTTPTYARQAKADADQVPAEVPTSYATKEEDYSNKAEIYAAPISIPISTPERDLASYESKNSAYDEPAPSYDQSSPSYSAPTANYVGPCSISSQPAHSSYESKDSAYLSQPDFSSSSHAAVAETYAAQEKPYTAAEKSYTEEAYAAPEEAYAPQEEPYSSAEKGLTSTSYASPDPTYFAPQTTSYVPQEVEYSPKESAPYAADNQAYTSSSSETYASTGATSYTAEEENYLETESNALQKRLPYEIQNDDYEAHAQPSYINSKQTPVYSDVISPYTLPDPHHYHTPSSHPVFVRHPYRLPATALSSVVVPSLYSQPAPTSHMVLYPEVYSAPTYPALEASTYSVDTGNYSAPKTYALKNAAEPSSYETEGDDYESPTYAQPSNSDPHHTTYASSLSSSHKASKSNLVLYPQVYTAPAHLSESYSNPRVHHWTPSEPYSTHSLSTTHANYGNSIFDRFSKLALHDLSTFLQKIPYPYGPIYYQPRFTQIVYNAR